MKNIMDFSIKIIIVSLILVNNHCVQQMKDILYKCLFHDFHCDVLDKCYFEAVLVVD